MKTAYIALGSNLGYGGYAPAETLRRAMDSLAEVGAVLARSSLYETAPVGYKDQPPFVNAVVAVATALAAEELLAGLMQLERRYDRDRSAGIANGPRTLDLDLLMLDQVVLHTAALTLPHPRMAQRRFVLQPLAEIAPDLRHPLFDTPMRLLLEALPRDGENRADAVRRLP